jgi:hypothetical protein
MLTTGRLNRHLDFPLRQSYSPQSKMHVNCHRVAERMLKCPWLLKRQLELFEQRAVILAGVLERLTGECLILYRTKSMLQ